MHVEKCSGDVSVDKALREIFLISLSALQYVIRGNFPATKRVSGGVTLFCVLIGLLSRIRGRGEDKKTIFEISY